MFKKKPAIKPLSPLRSSDRRKLAEQIIRDFHVQLPAAGTEAGDGKPVGGEGSHGSVSSIRNALVPENSQAARFTTTAGPKLKVVSGTVYVGPYAGPDLRILWVKVDERMYPTVYTLWQNPGLLPLLHTPSTVLHKIRGGADLMTPGLARGPPFPAAAVQGAVVAIASLEEPGVPLAVGVCEIDVSALHNVRGEKGRAVSGFQWEGDELWGWSLAGKPGVAAPSRIEGWDVEDTDGLGQDVAQIHLRDHGNEDGGAPLAREVTADPAASGNRFVQGEDAPVFELVDVEAKEMSPKEIDETFLRAFLYGVYHYKSAHGDAPSHGLNFPLPSSFVMSDLVLPFLPTFSPTQTASLQIKKTSWKNLKKFIKFLDKEKLIRSKERNGGETVVLDVDFDDVRVVNFAPYSLPKKESSHGKAMTSDTGSGDASIGQQLKQLTLYRPKEKLRPIFEASQQSTKQLYSASDVRQSVTAYIDAELLAAASNKRLVKLNPVLANAVFDTTSALDKEALVKGEAPREVLMERVLAACAPFWAVRRGNESAEEVKPKAGAAPSIHIVLETRSGNKTATRVSGIEAYHISPQRLADELQKTCASSTSVGQLVGSSPKQPVMEIMVQGPQDEAVIKALEKRGVKRPWIQVLDKTKGKKR
ncbi:MAG: hypothetical protein M1838_004827 [Thelocarpon superellum]|nr:MAG: hypothetical protein M1838_004827 [Thelocarpon superellum]